MILRDTETEPEENVKGRSGRERQLKKKPGRRAREKGGEVKERTGIEVERQRAFNCFE